MAAKLRVTALAGALAASACGARGREDLVGQYESVISGGRDVWVLRDDGTCEITPSQPGAHEEAECEWDYQQRSYRSKVIVTLTTKTPPRHVRRYVLTPSKWPGQPVTIPITAEKVLRRIG